MLEREREQVAAAGRRLAALGLALGAAGNVSRRSGDRICVTAGGAVLESVGAEQVSIVDVDGVSLDGPAPSSELALHVGAYERFGCGAVVHAHPAMATALACVLDELPAIHYQMVELGGSVPVARYETFGTAELAAVTLDAMDQRTAVMMANHGTLTYADDLEQAIARTMLLEWVAGLYWRAAGIGTPRALSAGALDDVRAQLERRNYQPLRTGEASDQ